MTSLQDLPFELRSRIWKYALMDSDIVLDTVNSDCSARSYRPEESDFDSFIIVGGTTTDVALMSLSARFERLRIS